MPSAWDYLMVGWWATMGIPLWFLIQNRTSNSGYGGLFISHPQHHPLPTICWIIFKCQLINSFLQLHWVSYIIYFLFLSERHVVRIGPHRCSNKQYLFKSLLGIFARTRIEIRHGSLELNRTFIIIIYNFSSLFFLAAFIIFLDFFVIFRRATEKQHITWRIM